MPKQSKMMTARRAETLRKPGFHLVGGVPGLGIAINDAGGRSWILRYSIDGKRREMGLGSFGLLTLAEARDVGREARRQIAAGGDPLESRRAERARARYDAATAMTFRQCADAYIQAHEKAWTGRTADNWLASFRDHADAVLGSLPVGLVDTPALMKVVEPLWNEKPKTGNKVRGRIEAVLNWATSRGYRSGDNPARWRGHIANMLPSPSRVHRTQHLKSLPYVELPAYMARLRQQDGIPARALEFLILTAMRSAEVTGARWDEFDLAERVWIVPAPRMKDKRREHRVPLSDATMAIVEAMAAIRQNELVFPGQQGGVMTGLSLRRAATGRHDGVGLPPHGFRTTFRTWAAEQTNYPREVAEMALSHQVGSAVERSYQRSDLLDQRRRLMQEWARFCAMPAPAEDGDGKVVPIRA